MKLNIYRATNHGLERVNDQPLTTDEAREIIKANPLYTMRDASSYDVTELEDWHNERQRYPMSEPPTERELNIAKNFSLGIKIALGMAIVLFIAASCAFVSGSRTTIQRAPWVLDPDGAWFAALTSLTKCSSGTSFVSNFRIALQLYMVSNRPTSVVSSSIYLPFN